MNAARHPALNEVRATGLCHAQSKTRVTFTFPELWNKKVITLRPDRKNLTAFLPR
jgi:hypothetical protein